MPRVGTSNLNLGMWLDEENPGAGSQTSDNNGLNGNFIKLDLAIGTAHNADGTHKSAVIDKAHIASTICDATTIEKDVTVGLRIKDLGVSTAKIAATAVTTAKIAANAVDDTILKSDGSIDANRAVTTNHIRDTAVTAAKLASNAVETAKIKDANVTTAKLEYEEYIAFVSQSGTGAPTATVVKNTMAGTPSWSRNSTGVYVCDFTTVKSNKTVAWCQPGINFHHHNIEVDNLDLIILTTLNNSHAVADSLMVDTMVFIRNY